MSLAATGSISGRVFNDVNLDGTRDPGEGDVPDVVVELLDAQGVSLQNTVTHSPYLFSDVAPGSYTVRIYPGPGQVPTTPIFHYSVTVGPAEAVTGVDFGIYDEDANGSKLTTLLPPGTQFTQSSVSSTTASGSGSTTQVTSGSATTQATTASVASPAKPIGGTVPAYTGSNSGGALLGLGAGLLALGALLTLSLRRRREDLDS